MEESVDGLSGILRDEARRCVAIIADRHFSVAALHPAFILLPHDMAVRASFRPVCHVRVSARVPERIEADPEEKTRNHRQKYRTGIANRWKVQPSHTSSNLPRPSATRYDMSAVGTKVVGVENIAGCTIWRLRVTLDSSRE
jgi:hypothetical protein